MPTTNRLSSAARVTVRQLCNLGLVPGAVLPSLLPALRALIPSDHAAFFFCDDNGGISNLYAERMLSAEVMAVYHEKHSLSTHSGSRAALQARINASMPISRHSHSDAEQTSDYHRDVLAPLGIKHILYAIVRHRNHVVGQLSLYRGANGTPFSSADEETLAGVVRYLGQALGSANNDALPTLRQEIGDEALAVLDLNGNVLFCDSHWQRLIRMSRGGAIAPSSAREEAEGLPAFVLSMLAATSASPRATHATMTNWGQFLFKRYDLRDSQDNAVVALGVGRVIPEGVVATTGAATLMLSPKQREVALLLAKGAGNVEIAQTLGVTNNTASFHVKAIFQKLGVHDRTQVIEALRAAGC